MPKVRSRSHSLSDREAARPVFCRMVETNPDLATQAGRKTYSRKCYSLADKTTPNVLGSYNPGMGVNPLPGKSGINTTFVL